MGGITCLGQDWPAIRAAMEMNRTGVRFMPEWDRFSGIGTRLAAPGMDFDAESRYPRKKTRTMGRVSLMAVYATERALEDAGLLGAAVLRAGRTGAAYGSSFGSPDAVLGFFELKKEGTGRNLTATSYVQM